MTDYVMFLEIDILLPNTQHQNQHRPLHILKDVLPCALC